MDLQYSFLCARWMGGSSKFVSLCKKDYWIFNIRSLAPVGSSKIVSLSRKKNAKGFSLFVAFSRVDSRVFTIHCLNVKIKKTIHTLKIVRTSQFEIDCRQSCGSWRVVTSIFVGRLETRGGWSMLFPLFSKCVFVLRYVISKLTLRKQSVWKINHSWCLKPSLSKKWCIYELLA